MYALMASVKIPLYGPGWNNFAYSVHATQPVTEALLSIQGFYTTVYGYEPTDTADPWKVYDVTVPEWVNDLEVLEFGHGYWITVTEDITLYLKGALDAALAPEVALQTPPATYYGAVLPGFNFTPESGLTVTAWVDGNRCGRSQTLEVGGKVVYVVAVHAYAESPGDGVGCGLPGRTVRFCHPADPLFPDPLS